MGRHSLELYSLSIVVAVGLNIVVLAHAPSFAEWIAIDSFAFALLALAAASLAHRRAMVQ